MRIELTVTTKSHDYPILIVNQSNMGSEIIPYIKGNQIMIVTNETVAPLYLEQLIADLASTNQTNTYEVFTIILPDGEQYKTQEYITKIYDALISHNCNRDVTLVALGGGVVGDMTGFAAASFMRGVDFIQIPTTLLSQVDSSVGGKTGINHPQGKNIIGAFWQPKMVLADMATLKTLPKRELSAGMAEVIKYALVMDLGFLDWLERNMQSLMDLETSILSTAVAKCCQYKADIVAKDERESGQRALLNFGHTFGHVIETHEGYGNWLHGEAVAAGMVQAAELSYKMGLISRTDVTRIQKLLTACGLPTKPPNIAKDTAIRLMHHDKKVKSGQIHLILLKSLGEAFITNNFDEKLFQEVLDDIC